MEFCGNEEITLTLQSSLCHSFKMKAKQLYFESAIFLSEQPILLDYAIPPRRLKIAVHRIETIKHSNVFDEHRQALLVSKLTQLAQQICIRPDACATAALEWAAEEIDNAVSYFFSWGVESSASQTIQFGVTTNSCATIYWKERQPSRKSWSKQLRLELLQYQPERTIQVARHWSLCLCNSEQVWSLTKPRYRTIVAMEPLLGY